MPEEYRVIRCIVCGKETANWVIKRLYMHAKGEIVEVELSFCRGCMDKLDDKLKEAEAMAVQDYFFQEGIDLEGIIKPGERKGG